MQWWPKRGAIDSSSQHAIEQVNNQIASLRATVAALQTSQARLPAQGRFRSGARSCKNSGRDQSAGSRLREESFRVAEPR